MKNILKHSRRHIHFYTKKRHWLRDIILVLIGLFLITTSIIIFWISSFKIPDLKSFENRTVAQSTKIFDRTGEILLYDVFENKKTATVPINQISHYIKNATVAIEDAEFYQHKGIKPTAIIRAVLANISNMLGAGGYSQGGSTITQQVIKNSLLTTEKSVSRKIKEWVLSLEIERVLNKDQILEIYLNESPYGGTIYGVEEASQIYFGKSAIDLTLAESAYLAALPQAPSLYSPYGNGKTKLEARKNLVLQKMLENKFISQDEFDKAKTEKVTWKPQEKTGIKAPHFVTFIRQYLENKYGTKAINENGYRVITTLDYKLQEKAEETVKKYALENEKNFKAENASLVAIDPKTGQIISMVGSRDYFDKEIDGNFNVSIAHRQPGSTFKPFVYATAFNKGYTPDTVLFDVPTEFQSSCDALGKPLDTSTKPEECYMPENYDGKYTGPISLRDALAQSRNIPAIKTLYLAGIADSIATARSLGIESLDTPERYGLTLVLGGGEVSLLEMTNAYGVFADKGTKNKYTGILKIEDKDGNIIENFSPKPEVVMNENVALQITDILSDNKARTPAYGSTSVLYFPGRDVAVKTGTTNDYKDAWIIGYTPNLVVGCWAGNNDNTPMEKKVAGQIIAPLWNSFMKEALKTIPDEKFSKPAEVDKNLKPILRGFWKGNETFTIDTLSGGLATELTPKETQKEVSITNIHSILYWIDKKNPLGLPPENPDQDYQFNNWETAVQLWLTNNPQATTTKPTFFDTIHTQTNQPRASFVNPLITKTFSKNDIIPISLNVNSPLPIKKVEYYLNGEFLTSINNTPFYYSINTANIEDLLEVNELKAIVYDVLWNKNEVITNFKVNLTN